MCLFKRPSPTPLTETGNFYSPHDSNLSIVIRVFALVCNIANYFSYDTLSSLYGSFAIFFVFYICPLWCI